MPGFSPIFAISDVAVTQIATVAGALLAMLTTCFTGYIGYLVAKLNKDTKIDAENVRITLARSTEQGLGKADEISRIVEKSSENDSKQLSNLAIVARSTHTFLNSERGELLRKLAEKCDRSAALDPTPENFQDAKVAHDAWTAHQSAQKLVDDQPGTDAEKKGTSN